MSKWLDFKFFCCPTDKFYSKGATCIQTGTDDDEFTCRCIPGFVGRLCDISETFYSFQHFNPLSDENNCLVNLCQNGGECIDGLNNFDCECQELFCNL